MGAVLPLTLHIDSDPHLKDIHKERYGCFLALAEQIAYTAKTVDFRLYFKSRVLICSCDGQRTRNLEL